MRIRDGRWNVYVSIVDGEPVPETQQYCVFSDKSQWKAQLVFEALTKGLLYRVGAARATELGRRRARSRITAPPSVRRPSSGGLR
jgi:hypothetical protein